MRITSPSPDDAFSGGLVEVASCRFGGEVANDLRTDPPTLLPGPPRFAIEMGSTARGQTVTGVHVRDCWFFGRTDKQGPSDTSALATRPVGSGPLRWPIGLGSASVGR